MINKNTFLEMNKEYENLTIEEIITKISFTKEEMERLVAFEEKYIDDLQDLEEEKTTKFDKYYEMISRIEEKEQIEEINRVNYLKKYNKYNDELIGTTNIKDNLIIKLRQIDNELLFINRKEQLLKGKLSSKLQNRKKELLLEKELIQKNKQNLKESKNKEYASYNECLKKIEDLLQQKNEVLDQMKIESDSYDSKILNIKNKLIEYEQIKEQIKIKLQQRKNTIDQEFNEISNRFKDALAKNDMAYLAVLGNEFIEKKNEKIINDKEYSDYLKLLNFETEKKEITNSDEKSKEEPKVNDEELKETNDKSLEHTMDEKLENGEKNNSINPIIWYDNYKQLILEDDKYTEEQKEEINNYIEQLKQEFISLFASFRRIDYTEQTIKEAIVNSEKLINKKIEEIVNSIEDTDEKVI